MAEKQLSIGALWLKEGKNGTYMTGNITIEGLAHKIVVFHNDRKEDGSKYPDWRIYLSTPREDAF